MNSIEQLTARRQAGRERHELTLRTAVEKMVKEKPLTAGEIEALDIAAAALNIPIDTLAALVDAIKELDALQQDIDGLPARREAASAAGAAIGIFNAETDALVRGGRSALSVRTHAGANVGEITEELRRIDGLPYQRQLGRQPLDQALALANGDLYLSQHAQTRQTELRKSLRWWFELVEPTAAPVAAPVEQAEPPKPKPEERKRKPKTVIYESIAPVPKPRAEAEEDVVSGRTFKTIFQQGQR